MKLETLRRLKTVGILLVPLTACGDSVPGTSLSEGFDSGTSAGTGDSGETGESGSTGDETETGDPSGDGDGDGDPGDGDGDEEWCMTGETRPCYTGPPETDGVGSCTPGVETCFNGVFFECMGDIVPTSETCNGRDDDCNGEIDDGDLLGIGVACDTGLLGQCTNGTSMCDDGDQVCMPNQQPSPEICFNNIDENCNGQADESCFCPYVYAFDGRGWRYESSVGGASLVGLARHLQPGHGKRVRFAPLWVRLDAAAVLDDRSVHAQILAAEDEIVYLDHAELTVVYHPPGHEVVSSTAMQWSSLKQRDPRALWAFPSARCRPPVRASWCGELDQRAALSTRTDTPAAYALERDNRYELDFGHVEHPERAWLLIDGWKFKHDRGLPEALRGRAPTIEIRQADGSWLAVKTIASVRGDRKTVAVDLSGLAWPTGAYELRLSTGTHEGGTSVWCLDRVRLIEAAPASVSISRIAASEAALEFRGLPTLLAARADHPRLSLNDGEGRGEGQGEPRTYGRFTRYGDVTPLVQTADDQLVVMRQGDLVSLRFDDVPEAPAGFERSLLLRTNLVFKPRVVVGSEGPSALTEHVNPMPRRFMGRYELDARVSDAAAADAAYREYLARWNTREYCPATLVREMRAA